MLKRQTYKSQVSTVRCMYLMYNTVKDVISAWNESISFLYEIALNDFVYFYRNTEKFLCSSSENKFSLRTKKKKNKTKY